MASIYADGSHSETEGDKHNMEMKRKNREVKQMGKDEEVPQS